MTDDELHAPWKDRPDFKWEDVMDNDLLQHQTVDLETRTRAAATPQRALLTWVSDMSKNIMGGLIECRTNDQYDRLMSGVSCNYGDARWRCAEWSSAIHDFIRNVIIANWGDPNCLSYRGLDDDPEVMISAETTHTYFVWNRRDDAMASKYVFIVYTKFGTECGGCFGCRATPENHEVASYGWVYFLRAKDTGHVKIGHSVHPYGRLSSLQTGNASLLNMLALMPGGRAVERGLHSLFAKDRVRPDGEWFHPSRALMAFIQEVGGVPDA